MTTRSTTPSAPTQFASNDRILELWAQAKAMAGVASCTLTLEEAELKLLGAMTTYGLCAWREVQAQQVAEQAAEDQVTISIVRGTPAATADIDGTPPASTDD